MLEIEIIMNSSVEAILAFKCCSLPDQNLEIHLINNGDRPLTVPTFFLLENGQEKKKITNVYPPGSVTVAPGDRAAIYCSMDEMVWEQYDTITFLDQESNTYRFPIR